VALAALTITMPALPVDGQIERFVSKVTITSLTVSANSGQNMDGTQPYTLNPGVGAEFIYVASGSIWTRLY
jgi:hypothetical protein